MLGTTSSTCGTRELEGADLLVLVNCDPFTETPVLGWRIKRLIKKGKQAIVINSSDIGLGRHATVWLDPRRGTSTHLLNGVISEIIRNNSENSEYLASRCADFDRFRLQMEMTDVDEVASVSGVRPEKIARAAQLIAEKDRKVVAVYNLDSRRDRSVSDLKALASLLLITGRIGTEGSGLILLSSQCNNRGIDLAGFDEHLLPGGELIRPESVARVAALWNSDLTFLKNGDRHDWSNDFRRGVIKGAIILGENPAIDAAWAARIEHLEFLVVADMFLTETAKLADIVLPLNSYVEDEGTITNWEGRRQTISSLGQPLAGMTNLEMIANIALRSMGTQHLSPSREQLREELDRLLPPAGVAEDCFGRFRLRFPTSDGKAHFEMYPTQARATEVAILKYWSWRSARTPV